MRNKVCLALLGSALVFTSCNDRNNDSIEDEVVVSATAKSVTNLDASDNTKWVYYSFAKNDTVSVTTPETDLNWDIAFNRYNIKTNGGTSGAGKAEVVRVESKDFDAVTVVPTSGYEKDIEKETTLRGQGGTYTTIKTSLNNVITGTVGGGIGWWTYTPPATQTGSPHFEVTNWVYVVKTAEGNPVKIQLTSYNNTITNVSGFISFQYKEAGSNNQF